MHVASNNVKATSSLAIEADVWPQRISVVGRAGAGKTTYAKIIGKRLGLPVTHLDALYWTPDWREVDREVFEAQQADIIGTERWVIDGGYLSSQGWPDRASRSDLIVVAEAPIRICLWRVLRRSLVRTKQRPDRAVGGGEQVSLYFLWWIVTWKRRHPRLAESLEAAGHRVLVARSIAELELLLLRIGASLTVR